MFIVLQSTSFAQKFSIVASGNYLPNYSMTPGIVDINDIKYTSLYSYGFGLIVKFTYPFNFNTGIEIFYGPKDKIAEMKPVPNPYAPADAEPVLGTSRGIQWLRLDFPILYRIFNNDHFTLDGGIKIGIGNLKQIDRLVFYDIRTGAELSRNEGSFSQKAIFYSPTIDVNIPILNSFSFITGIEYIFFEPKFEDTATISLDPYPSYNTYERNEIHSEWKWHLSGMQFSCSIMYSF